MPLRNIQGRRVVFDVVGSGSTVGSLAGIRLWSAALRATTNRMICPVPPRPARLVSVTRVPTGKREKSTTTSNRSAGATGSVVCRRGAAGSPWSDPIWTNEAPLRGTGSSANS
ncbi:hypothetical protein [Streptomyces sp. NBC_00370]|uniref:hypothetical protein n=1 Tax=Streptomyces sp. NBC_00370 TaxID=2975728 RepID=UPI002E26E81A